MAFRNQRPRDMTATVLARTNTPQIPRSFAAAHPGYGANAQAALDEKLADELASRRARTTSDTTSTIAIEHTRSLAEIDVDLEAARRTTAAAKAAYDAALAAENGLEMQKEMMKQRGEKMRGLKEVREEKMRRRERALAMKKTAGSKPCGIRKMAVEKKGKGVRAIAAAIAGGGGSS